MSAPLACKNCGGTEIDKDPSRGHAVCMGCGSVLEDSCIVSEVQFADNGGGGSSVVGQFVSSEGGPPRPSMGAGFHPGMGKESREITLQKGRRKVTELAAMLQLNQKDIDMACNFYKLALNQQATKGRKSPHVIAACVYFVCRLTGTPHMLLDLSDVLQINVYTLGRTYLALAKKLNIKIPAIDPSILIPRFAHKLEYGDKTHVVVMTAVRFVARMKRDWMAMGRRPSGLCGAALLVASRVHNFCRTKKDIIKVVKVCESTLRKRLIEFEDTASGNLTIDEFQTIDLEEEADPPSFTQSRKEAKLKQMDEIMTNDMSNEITEISTEIDKELETRSSKQVANMEKEAFSRLLPDEVVGDAELEDPNATSFLESEIISESINSTDSPSSSDETASACQRPTAASLGLTTPVIVHEEVVDDNVTGELDLDGLDDDELETFILTDDEVRCKERAWMALNGEFLKEQEEKAKRKAEEEAAKPPKVRRKRRKINITASTAGEAVEKLLREKKLSNKINYEVLKNLTNGGTSDLVNKMIQEGGTSTGSTQSNTHSLDSTDSLPGVSYLPEVVDETPSTSQVSVSKRGSRTKATPLISRSRGSNKEPSSSTTLQTEPALVQQTVVETGAVAVNDPVVESGPIQHEEDYGDDEHDEDDDQPMSAAQLMGHVYAADEEDYDYD